MKVSSSAVRAALILAVSFGGPLSVSAESRDDEIQALREQIRQLDQKLRVLERKQELADEAATAAAKSQAKLAVSEKGAVFTSPDAVNSIRLRGLVHLDSRLFFGDGGIANNAFILRRARIIAEGTLARDFAFQVVPEFAGSSASLLDANVTFNVTKSSGIKFGKFKSPVGYEQLQSDTGTFFAERALPSNLTPNRDVGIQLGGDLLDGRVTYAAGVFGGVADSASTNNSDFDNDKDIAGRVFVSPFKNEIGSPLHGLGFGVSGSIGRQKTSSALASGYRTPGQQTFFRYRPGAINDGHIWRFSPHLDYRNGSFGLLGEYVVSTVNARAAANAAKTELQHHAWQVAAGYVLTGEDSSYGGVVPETSFDPVAGTWGAFEVVARFEDLKIDSAAFPLLADPASSANEASSLSVGLNWYLNKAVRATFDYYHTSFENNVAAPSSVLLQQDERAFISRLQLAF